MAALPFGQFGMQAAIWVTAQRALADSPHREFLQTVQVLMYALGLQVAVGAQEKFQNHHRKRGQGFSM